MAFRRRKPTTPGEILQEEYLSPLKLTQKELADHIGCDVKVINRLVNGRTGITAPLALKLAAVFSTTPDSGSMRKRRLISTRLQKQSAAFRRPSSSMATWLMPDLQMPKYLTKL